MVLLEGQGAARSEPIIRLRVGYHSVESLVKEYTASLGRGGCLLVTRKGVALGARFIFEMSCEGSGERLVVEGEVVRVRPVSAACEAYELAIQYRSSVVTRAALDELLARFEVDRSYAVIRESPRIPVNLPAGDSMGEQRYFVRDVSTGGMRIECVRGACQVALGDRVLLGVQHVAGPKVFVNGTVRWVGHASRGGELQFGVRFDQLGAGDDPRRAAVTGLVQLRRPSQVFVHIVDLKSKQASRLRVARELRRIEPSEVRAAVAEVAHRELAAPHGLEVVDSPVDHLFEQSACAGLVRLAGDLVGEVRLRANGALSSALQDADGRVQRQALQSVAERIGHALCRALAAAGLSVEVAAAGSDAVPADSAADVVVATFFAGELGLASLYVVARAPTRGSSRSLQPASL